jgi:hypothetical protein
MQRTKGHRRAFVRPARLAKVHEQFMCLPNTYATFVGIKKTTAKGRRKQRNKVAIVCLVREKVPDGRLLPERSIPRSLRWRERGRGRVVRTDVVALAPSYEHASGIAGPGDPLSAHSVIATVGVAISHPAHGDCVTTAGHFIEMAQSPAAVQLQLGNDVVDVSVRTVTMTASLDYAVLKPRNTVQCANLFADLTRIGPVFEPSFTDIGKRVFVVDRQNAKRIPTICRGVHASVSLPEETLSDCILTDLVTEAGQSGTCLVDDTFRVWGLLRGRLSSQFSVFMPVRNLLHNENARLL